VYYLAFFYSLISNNNYAAAAVAASWCWIHICTSSATAGAVNTWLEFAVLTALTAAPYASRTSIIKLSGAATTTTACIECNASSNITHSAWAAITGSRIIS
jgi:hypothetical protein